MNNIFIFISFFIVQLINAQSNGEKLINGQITINGISSIKEVDVVNTSNKIVVISDKNGQFSILAKEGDILFFSSNDYNSFRRFINRKEFETSVINVDLTPKSIQLKEVIIDNNSNITAESLGIIPSDQVKLTPAERRLRTAGDFKPIHLLGLLGGSVQIDPILNAMNGKTKMLKKEVIVEKKEFLITKLQFLFEEKYYIETLKIAKELIRGFQYYCVDNAEFVKSLNDKNKTMCMFIMARLSSEFNENRIIDEK